MRTALSSMSILLLFVLVYGAGFATLAALVVLETDLCPFWLRERLSHVRLPATEQEEERKREVRSGHVTLLKKLHTGAHS